MFLRSLTVFLSMIVISLGAARAEGVAEHAVTGVFAPNTDIRSTALMIAGGAADQNAAELTALARTLADMNTLVILIEADWLLDLGGGCSGAVPSLLSISEEIGKRRGAAPRAPVLMGIGAGTAVARAAAAQAPNRFKGLVTAGLARDLPDPCRTPLPETGRKTVLRWHEVASEETSALAGVRGVRFYPPEDRSPEATRAAQVKAYLALAGTDHAFDTDTGAEGLDDLPITLHLPEADAPPPPAYVIFLSGDGGWANFDEEIADRLAKAGLPVIGISSMRYLWQERKPAKIAQDIARIDRSFAARFGTDRVILAGFSLGANVTPFYAPLLPETMAERVLGLALLSPETHTGFEVVMGGWLGQKTGSQDVVAALDALPKAMTTLCLFGEDDKHSACPATRHALPMAFDGGHHLGKSYDEAAGAILDLLP
ncbi:AcvB/VirJ family lysyl-phosphatidylglycerol hydrolase [Thioclava kandeliae]|uniref:AcvB/VirJ family lysyl-phosphatidylglycerol hydrolase n=1 Tax=Thioclava kandeliae TaxID=3070818 RepID=A0ABV1SBV5_9RHOB